MISSLLVTAATAATVEQPYVPGKKMVMIWSGVSSNETANDE